jgi:hypothetical protein
VASLRGIIQLAGRAESMQAFIDEAVHLRLSLLHSGGERFRRIAITNPPKRSYLPLRSHSKPEAP